MNREQWLEAAVEEFRPVFDAVGFPLPEKIRVTCGFPSTRARSRLKAVGEHWSPKASEDGTHEILISPVLDDRLEVLGTLIHELCHAATDGDGHGKIFTKSARAMHLEGKPTSTTAGAKFSEVFGDIIESLGSYPHARLNVGLQRKPQGTRMLKACCPSCGYTIRLTAKWAQLGLPTCPIDATELTL